MRTDFCIQQTRIDRESGHTISVSNTYRIVVVSHKLLPISFVFAVSHFRLTVNRERKT